MRISMLFFIASSFFLSGCVGLVSLHDAVLGYDEATGRLDREMLLLNIARTHQNLPNHFTVTSSIAATFDYRTNSGITANLFENPGSNNSYGLSLGASAAKNPTFSIVPIHGEEFSKRILTPMDESKFEFLIHQGASLNMVMRLMARGIEIQNRDGTFKRFILNSPSMPQEYEEFRRIVKHLGWLNESRDLFVGSLSYTQTLPLSGPLSPTDLMAAVDKGYRLRRDDKNGGHLLERHLIGRVAITNYDHRALGGAARAALNALASSNPANFILIDIRPGHPGDDFPIFGAVKLRSLNAIISFLASGISRTQEYDVKPDARSGPIKVDPARTLAVDVTGSQPSDTPLTISYRGKHYSVRNTPWDRDSFKLLYSLFQMTVTDVSKIGLPVTISK